MSFLSLEIIQIDYRYNMALLAFVEGVLVLAAPQLMHSECGRIRWVAFGEGGLTRWTTVPYFDLSV